MCKGFLTVAVLVMFLLLLLTNLVMAVRIYEIQKVNNLLADCMVSVYKELGWITDNATGQTESMKY